MFFMDLKSALRVAISIFFLLPIVSFAKGRLPANTVTDVAFQTGGFFLYADAWGNPNNCSRSNAVVLEDSDINYDKAYALVLAAYFSEKTISGYSDRCVEFDGQTYNSIRGFKYLVIG